jgi:Spy/CpxP family protein refolding chaperone
MNTRNIKLAGALLLGILMITTVNAQSHRQGVRGHGHGAGDGHSGMYRHALLDLTEEQQTEITTLRTAHYKAITPLKNKMVELKARERTLLSEESVDMKAIHKSIDEQTDLTNKMRKLQVEQQVAVKSLLTDEQVMKLQQRKHFARRDGFYGKSGHRGAGGKGNAGAKSMGRGYRGI